MSNIEKAKVVNEQLNKAVENVVTVLRSLVVDMPVTESYRLGIGSARLND